METVLILGGSGTVGSHLLEEIGRRGLARRMRFNCASRSDASARKIRAHGFEVVPVDLEESQSVKAAVQDVTTIFLLKPYALKMLSYAKRVVDAAACAGVRAIVNLSAFGPDTSCIDLLSWHRLVDSYIERSGISFTHLRPSFFMEGLVARINREAGVVYDLSESKAVPWVAAADIASVAATILADPSRHAGKAYSLISETSSAASVAHLLSELCGREFKAMAMDEATAINGLVARGREPLFARAIVEYAKSASTFVDSDATDTVQAITGSPGTRLREFLGSHVT